MYLGFQGSRNEQVLGWRETEPWVKKAVSMNFTQLGNFCADFDGKEVVEHRIRITNQERKKKPIVHDKIE